MKTKFRLVLPVIFFAFNSFAQHIVSEEVLAFKLYRQPFSSLKTIQAEYRAEKIKPVNDRPLIQLFDSIYSWQWDQSAAAWKLDNKTINFVYNSNHEKTSELVQSWNKAAWQHKDQNSYTYDAKGNNTNWLSLLWNGNAWINAWEYTFTYNANNKRTRWLHRKWENNAWVNNWQLIFTYDTNNNETSFITQTWKDTAWTTGYKDTSFYDLNNNLTMHLSETWNPLGNTWEKVKTVFTTDAKGKLTNKLSATWNGTAWENSSQYTYTYDTNSNNVNILNESWNGTGWENSSQSILIKDANNNNVSELNQNWNGTAWVKSSHTITTFDANNFMKSYAFKVYDNTGVNVNYGDSTYYNFHTVLTGISSSGASDKNVKIYPNPSDGRFTVELTNNQQLVNLEIYEPTGAKILQQVSNEVNIQHVASGIYFVKMKDGKNTYVKKIMVR